jgi:hypothetical protein
VAASDAEYVAFTDSDCVPTTGWLAAGVAALDGGADVVNGVTCPARPPKPLERTTASAHEGLYPTSNVFYRRSAYDAVGGFDTTAAERLRFRFGRKGSGLGFGEDTLLGWAVRRKGTAVTVEEALVHHHVFPPDPVDLVHRTLLTAAFPALVREVPELRETPLVRSRFFLATRNRVPVYALALALAARRRTMAAAFLGSWVGLRSAQLRDAPGRPVRRLAALPAVLALDVLGASALVAGSVRARTVLL